MRQHDAPVKGVHSAMQFYYVMLVKMFVSSRDCTMQNTSLLHAEALAKFLYKRLKRIKIMVPIYLIHHNQSWKKLL